jgi:hypothetical protein
MPAGVIRLPGVWSGPPVSERRQKLDVRSPQRADATVEGDDLYGVPPGHGQQMRVSHLSMTHQRRHIRICHRHVVGQKAMAAGGAEQCQHAARFLHADCAWQDSRIGRDADEATFRQRAGSPAIVALCRKPLSRRRVVNVRVPRQRNERVDIE